MDDVTGTWNLTMKTPIGSLRADVVLVEDAGVLSGTAAGAAETVALRNLRVEPDGDGHRVTWSQSITKPLRLNLDFDVTVRGDDMHGFSRAGRLPRSTVTGSRAR